MPRVKIDYVVSFSSEDPDNQASNLLAWEVSKKKWLCSKGEPSCSVVLQLTKAVKISAVHVGAHHAALVEVLVGRSEKPNEAFQVLVPSCIFLSPGDSRKDTAVERVRSFTSEQLASDVKTQKWDRVRVVCSQPYNKHCKYGLSFIHIYEPEDSSAPPSLPPAVTAPTTVPPRLFSLDTYSSDDDDFRPGELFAKHQQKLDKPLASTSTDAQIRQASSQALKNISDSSTKLMKTPITKASSKHYNTTDHNTDRKRDSLMYTDDDEQPHAKIDRIVQGHKDEKSKKDENDKRQEKSKEKKYKDDDKHRRDDKGSFSKTQASSKERDASSSRKNERDDSHSSKKERDASSSRKNDKEDAPQSSKKDRDRKRPHSGDRKDVKGGSGLRVGPVSASPHTLLNDVVFVLSGYENPERGQLRDIAMSLGAKFERDWTPNSTHLICAFPNTPKLRSVRGSRNGNTAVVVTGQWLRLCHRHRRRVPWQWCATETKHKVQYSEEELEDNSPQSHGSQEAADDECDTDDEIEKVLQKQKKQRTRSPSKSPPRRDKSPNISARSPNISANMSAESDVAFIRDERMQGHVTIEDSDEDQTDEDDTKAAKERIDSSKTLPDFFDGCTFVIDDDVGQFDRDLLSRYVKAYGGIVLEASQLDEDSEVQYVVCGRRDGGAGARGLRLRADWLWRCHKERTLCSTDGYTLA